MITPTKALISAVSVIALIMAVDFLMGLILRPRDGEPSDCPHDSADLPGGVPTLAGAIATVPEFHDCQRFLVVDPATRQLTYAGRFAIYVGLELKRLPDSGSVTTTVGGAVGGAVGGTVAPPDGGIPFPIVQPADRFLLSYAEIFADAAYPALGITAPGYWCLGMYRELVDNEWIWRAKMIDRQVLDGNTCRQEIKEPDTVPGKQLEVRKDDIGDVPTEAVPGVARWDWDRVNRQQYIGIAGCWTPGPVPGMQGGGWCEIGDSGFVASPTYRTVGTEGPSAWTRRVKGWYDEQLLAFIPDDKNPISPAAVYGTYWPAPDLGEHYHVNEFHDSWVRVGSVQLDTVVGTAGQDQYKRTYNYDPAVHPGSLNQVYMCSGSRSQCLGWWSLLPIVRWFMGMPACKGAEGDGRWWARIVATDRTAGYRCVTYRTVESSDSVGKIVVPGTVRWRWKALDEGTWARCPEGCCEMQ